MTTLLDDQAKMRGEQALPGGGVFYATKLGNSFSGDDEIKRETLYLGSLDTIIDRLQELFDQWENQAIFPATIRLDMLDRARLAAHEWIAHLVQYADFEDRMPQIALSVWAEANRLCCLVADNSSGFKLETYPKAASDPFYDVMPERGMCWLLIEACTERRAYRPLGNQGFELEFSIS